MAMCGETMCAIGLKWGDGTPATATTYYNDGAGPDPYPSPGRSFPFTATDSRLYVYGMAGTHFVMMMLFDDGGGAREVLLLIEVSWGRAVDRSSIRDLVDRLLAAASCGSKAMISETMQVDESMAVVEEEPRVPLCHICGARIPMGWKVLMGKAKCPLCGTALLRFLPRRVPWWIVLHLKPDFVER